METPLRLTRPSFTYLSLIMSFMTCFIVWSNTPSGHQSPSILYPVVGGFNLWLFVLMLLSTAPVVFFNLYYKDSWLAFISSTVGRIAAIVLLLLGVGMQFLGEPKNTLLVLVNSISATWVIFCFFTFWTRFRVEDDTIVVLNDKIFYPGEKYFISPFFSCYFFECPKNVELQYEKIMIQCQDAKFVINIKTAITLDLSLAKEKKIPRFDYDFFKKELKRTIQNNILAQAKNMTSGQLLSDVMDPFDDNIAGMPYSWNGEINFSGETKKQSTINKKEKRRKG